MKFMTFRREARLISTMLMVMLISSEAKASTLTFCETVFGPRVTATLFSHSIPILSEAEIEIWEDTFSDAGRYVAIPSLNHTSDLTKENLMVWWMFEKFPITIQDRLRAIDRSGQDVQAYLRVLLRQTTIDISRGYLKEFVLNYIDFRSWNEREPVTISTWIERGLTRLEKSRQEDHELDAALENTYAQEMQVIDNQRFWDIYGIQDVPAVQLPNDLWEVTIGKHIFNGKVVGGQFFLDNVPVHLTSGASTKTPQNRAPTVSLPKVFTGELGLDGRFFISAHYRQFRIEERHFVQIRLPWPLRTTSLQKYLSLIGARNPHSERIEAFRLGNIPFEALLPGLDRQKLVFDPLDTPSSSAP